MPPPTTGPSTVFTPGQVKDLSGPLNRAMVKQREQSGRRLSYIEGWHAIGEANRIFGFDAWHRETVELRCVSERERKIGREPKKPSDPPQRDGWGVTYVARVRVTVSGIVRDGSGAGHGIDVDPGLAHESALKEAETDAMKRALMTFGNPFGLALYDKTQAAVADIPQPPPPALVAQAQAAADRAGFTPEGLESWLDEISNGEASSLAQLPARWLQKLIDTGVHPDVVASHNRNAATPTEPPATWQQPAAQPEPQPSDA